MAELAPRVAELARLAKSANMGLNIDAEEADRLDLSLDVIERRAGRPVACRLGRLRRGRAGLRAARRLGDRLALRAGAWSMTARIMVRLVKGAYWDTEIKRAQVLGADGYPVFTRKADDRCLLHRQRAQAARHDRPHLSAVRHPQRPHGRRDPAHMAQPDQRHFEFQRLHGMGETLHEIVRKRDGHALPHLCAGRRAHATCSPIWCAACWRTARTPPSCTRSSTSPSRRKQIAADPVAAVESGQSAARIPRISAAARPLPARTREFARLEPAGPRRAGRTWKPPWPPWREHPLRAAMPGASCAIPRSSRTSSARSSTTAADEAKAAVTRAAAAFPAWAGLAGRTPAPRSLNRAADLYEANAAELIALATREAGKTLADAVAEVREAVDFLRYYAARGARRRWPAREPRGVDRSASRRGTSRWRSSPARSRRALAAGNAVIAKPAEQTPLIAARAVRAAARGRRARRTCCSSLPGDGAVGRRAADRRSAHRRRLPSPARPRSPQLIERAAWPRPHAPDAMLIAETGGLNAMIVDSTALPEQAVRDILASAFQSAGQRCSALRILYVQEDVADADARDAGGRDGRARSSAIRG